MCKKIEAKYASKCRVCATEIFVGDSIWWEKGEKGICCADCGSENPEIAVTEQPISVKTTDRTELIRLVVDLSDAILDVTNRQRQLLQYIEFNKI